MPIHQFMQEFEKYIQILTSLFIRFYYSPIHLGKTVLTHCEAPVVIVLMCMDHWWIQHHLYQVQLQCQVQKQNIMQQRLASPPHYTQSKSTTSSCKDTRIHPLPLLFLQIQQVLSVWWTTIKTRKEQDILNDESIFSATHDNKDYLSLLRSQEN